jgi:hypothetical protein
MTALEDKSLASWTAAAMTPLFPWSGMSPRPMCSLVRPHPLSHFIKKSMSIRVHLSRAMPDPWLKSLRVSHCPATSLEANKQNALKKIRNFFPGTLMQNHAKSHKTIQKTGQISSKNTRISMQNYPQNQAPTGGRAARRSKCVPDSICAKKKSLYCFASQIHALNLVLNAKDELPAPFFPTPYRPLKWTKRQHSKRRPG